MEHDWLVLERDWLVLDRAGWHWLLLDRFDLDRAGCRVFIASAVNFMRSKLLKKLVLALQYTYQLEVLLTLFYLFALSLIVRQI